MAVPRSLASSFAPMVRRRIGAGDLRSRLAAMWWWLPALLAAGFAVLVLVHLPHTLVTFYRNSDAATPPVIAQLLGSSSNGAQVTLGDHSYYEELLFLILTRGLPLHRQIWYAAPIAFSLVGLGVFAWGTRRVFGSWPAAIATATLVCLGDYGLSVFFTSGTHASSAIHAVVLAAALVWVIPQAQRLGARRLAAIAGAVGLLSALATAGDDLFLAWGLVPLLATTVLVGWRGPTSALQRTVAFGLGTAAVALVGGAIFAHFMKVNGIHAYGHAADALLTFATPARLAQNLGVFLQGLTNLGGGDFFGQPATTFRGLADFASGALVLTGLVFVLFCVARSAGRATPRQADGGAPVTGQDVYVTFWTSCLIASIAAFLLGSPVSTPHAGRYLLGAYVSIAALLPLLLSRGPGWRLIATAAACVFAVLASYRVLRIAPQAGIAAPDSHFAAALTRFATQQHVQYGYADYWDAIELTWATRLRLKIFPVSGCAGGRPALCQFHEIEIRSWYLPRPGVRSMLIVDPAWPAVIAARSLGRPIAATAIGPIKVLVYGYDLAARLGRA